MFRTADARNGPCYTYIPCTSIMCSHLFIDVPFWKQRKLEPSILVSCARHQWDLWEYKTQQWFLTVSLQWALGFVGWFFHIPYQHRVIFFVILWIVFFSVYNCNILKFIPESYNLLRGYCTWAFLSVRNLLVILRWSNVTGRMFEACDYGQQAHKT